MQASVLDGQGGDGSASAPMAAPRPALAGGAAASSASASASPSSVRPRTLIHFKKNSKHAVSQALAQLGWAEVRLRIPPSGANKRRAVPRTGLSASGGAEGEGGGGGGSESEEDGEDADGGPSSRAEPIETPRNKVKQPRALLLNLPSYAATVVSSGAAPVQPATAAAAAAPVSHLNWDVAWVDLLSETEYASIGRLQRLNQFPHMHKLSKKKFLALHLNAMREREPHEYSFYPRSWVLPQQLQDLKQYYAQLDTGSSSSSTAVSSSSPSPSPSAPGSSLCDSPVLIVKPDFCCEGRGIYLVSSLSQIDLSVPLVVQQYLSRPLLLANRHKFDLRLYVLVLSVSPLSLALYDDGLTRVCTEEYAEPSASNLGNLCQHLTNYAINKKNEKFVYNTQADVSDVGNKWSVKSLFAKLRQEGHDVAALWRRISDLVVKSVLSSYGSLLHSHRTALGSNTADVDGGACFQFLGFDVMLDQMAQPALIEINRNCSLKCDTPLDSFVKVNAIKQTLQLIDPRAPYRYRSREVAAKEREELRGLSGKEYKEAQTRLWHKRCSARLRYEDETLASFDGGFRRIYPLAPDDDHQSNGMETMDASASGATAAAAASAVVGAGAGAVPSPATSFDVVRSVLMPSSERGPVYDRLMNLSIELHAEGVNQKRSGAGGTGSSSKTARRTFSSSARSTLRTKPAARSGAAHATTAPRQVVEDQASAFDQGAPAGSSTATAALL